MASSDIGYDVIGDVHGHADPLHALLARMGYVRRSGTWVPPAGRQAVFVGDLIDRGPAQLAVLDTVRRMVDAGHARAVMGNHEFNAIAWATPSAARPGEPLRAHTPARRAQHAEFLRQVGEGSARHREWLHWLRTLRPALDLGGIRVVHAWWHAPFVDFVSRAWPEGRPLDDGFLEAACDPAHPAWAAMEGLTKGLEVALPEGRAFVDTGGHPRHHVRLRWWAPAGATLRELALVDESQRAGLPDVPLAEPPPQACLDGAPVFVGHYWLRGRPAPQAPGVACLDYSVALGGPLVAYRWNGERELHAGSFVAVD